MADKSLADVLDSILSNWKRFCAFLALGLCLFLFILGLAYFVPKVISRDTKSFKLSTTEFLIESRGSEGQEEYLTIVQPQGWQKSGIEVKKGQHIHYSAGGKVCIDLDGLVNRAGALTKLENTYAERYKINRLSESPDQRPERYYSPEDVKALKLDQVWTGPDGFKNIPRDPSFAGRTSMRLKEKEPLGALVAAIQYGDQPPQREDVFLVGQRTEVVASADGFLWFNVNDVIDRDNDKSVGRPDDPENNLFYFDNIGAFWVQVTIEP